MADLLPSVSMTSWLGQHRFAYSIAYDEGLVETMGFAWRIHREFGFPGHINIDPRRAGRLEGDTSAGFLQSLWNLRKYAEPDHLKFLAGDGWSVGCQLPPGGDLPADELRELRLLLEDMTGSPVRSLAFESNLRIDGHRVAAIDAGYHWLQVPWDTLNESDWLDPPIIKRSPLYHRGSTPNRLAYDPYRLLASAFDRGAWVVDVVRKVDRFTDDTERDCTPAELAGRFRAVQRIGEGRVWTASVDTIATYRRVRQATRVSPAVATASGFTFDVISDAPSALLPVELTFELAPNQPWRAPQAHCGSRVFPLTPAAGPGEWLLTLPIGARQSITVIEGGPQ